MRGIPKCDAESKMTLLRTATAPRLQHFDITVVDSYRFHPIIPDTIFTGGAPALRSVRIVGPYRLCTLPLVQLTTLNLGGACRGSGGIWMTHEDLRVMLTASPSLADLTLQDLYLPPPSNENVADIQMPSLRTLSLNFVYCNESFFRILTLLSMPILETLSLAYMNRFDMFTGRGASNYTTLQTLKLFMCSYNIIRPPESLLSAFSSITHLYLISTADVILEPTRSGKIYWPNLKAVTISPNVSPIFALLGDILSLQSMYRMIPCWMRADGGGYGRK